MKVLLFNGSAHKEGSTYTALMEVAGELEKAGIETEIVQVGSEFIRGCIGCGSCKGKGEKACKGRCVFSDDKVNTWIDMAEEADGFVFGSPVYYAAASGTMTCAMDRMFYAGKRAFAYKPAASVVCARRAGTTAAYDQLNKYIGINNMIMVPAPYWNMVHGNGPEEVRQDEEGMYIMRTIGKNMAWLLKLLEHGKKDGLTPPDAGKPAFTNFIR